jgi:hypothetical protein
MFPLTCLPLSITPRHLFLPLSAALLGQMFLPPFITDSRTSTKRSSRAKMTLHVLFWDSPAHSILGLSASHSTWWKKRNNYLIFFMFVLLTLICQYISEIVLFCWGQNSDSLASEYQTTRFLPFMVCDCVCNWLPKLPNCKKRSTFAHKSCHPKRKVPRTLDFQELSWQLSDFCTQQIKLFFLFLFH